MKCYIPECIKNYKSTRNRQKIQEINEKRLNSHFTKEDVSQYTQGKVLHLINNEGNARQNCKGIPLNTREN